MRTLKHSIIPLAITAFLISACSGERAGEVKGIESSEAVKGTQESHPAPSQPIIAAEDEAGPTEFKIYPGNPLVSSEMNIINRSLKAEDADIQWMVNDRVVKTGRKFLLAGGRVKKGDEVRARANVQGGYILSNVAYVKNTPPEITRFRIMPEVFRPGDTLYVDVTTRDADGDDVIVFYEWTKNGAPAGDSARLAYRVKRGDTVTVRMRPFDGEEFGKHILRTREISNMPPMIADEGEREITFDDKVYTYKVKAEDPDGDKLAYSLKSAPEGVGIDAESGLITWNVPPDFSGKVDITVSVTDGQGGESTQELSFIIKPPEEVQGD
jgi:hypothetical protein